VGGSAEGLNAEAAVETPAAAPELKAIGCVYLDGWDDV
jgi:hypothetical protein